MKQILFRSAFIFLLIAGGTGTLDQGIALAASDKEPKLKVNAAPRQGFAPLRVTFRAELDGVDQDDQQYYCLQEEWDFGDGAKSTEKPNCEPHSPDTKVKTEFFIDHVYEKQGRYTVRLVLGDEKIRSRQVSVAVVERDRGYN